MEVKVNRSNRGFARCEPVNSEERGLAHLYESSAASSPHLWLNCEGPEGEDGERLETVAHLRLEDAEELRNQLEEVINSAAIDGPPIAPKPVPSAYGGFVSLDLAATKVVMYHCSPVDLNNPLGEMKEQTLRFSFQNAKLLRDQLVHLIENHYQVR